MTELDIKEKSIEEKADIVTVGMEEVITQKVEEQKIYPAKKDALPFCWPLVVYLGVAFISMLKWVIELIIEYKGLGYSLFISELINYIPNVIFIVLAILCLVKRNKIFILIFFGVRALTDLSVVINKLRNITIIIEVFGSTYFIINIIQNVIRLSCWVFILLQALTLYKIDAFNRLHKIWFLPAIILYCSCALCLMTTNYYSSGLNETQNFIMNLIYTVRIILSEATYATISLLLGMWIKKVAIKNNS